MKTTLLLAPNGKPSNLSPVQYKLVRTKAFKKWFGDWETSPFDSSKVIDENGEPLVVYHGSNKDFTEFKDEKRKEGRRITSVKGYYFTKNYWTAEKYSGIKGFIKPFFLSIKKIATNESPEASDYININDFLFDYGKTISRFGYDGACDLQGDFITFEPNQIKLADGSNTAFDENSNDIRFDDGGKVSNNLIAPNGKSSNLSPVQYELVRTPEFKKWFGDWENNPELSSKVIDENGEPLVVYHGTNRNFNVFDKKQIASNSRNTGHYGEGFYFSFELMEAKTYTDRENPKVLNCFLNIRNPFDAFNINHLERYAEEFGFEKKNVAVDSDWMKEQLKSKDLIAYKLYCLVLENGYEKGWELFLKDYPDGYYNAEVQSKFDLNDITHIATEWSSKDSDTEIPEYIVEDLESYFGKEPKLITNYTTGEEPRMLFMTDYGQNTNYITELIKKDGFDGIIAGSEIIIFESNQIKLADGTNTTFNTDSDDIRFIEGGKVSNKFLAPNGKPSNLNETQYKSVRTPEFKKWFGDWENSPLDSSKVIDENGEPLVVYHGTNADFDSFSEEAERKGYSHNGFFFTPNIIQAESYTFKGFSNPENIKKGTAYDGNANIMPVFLDIRNPLFVDSKSNRFSDIGAEEYKYNKEFVVEVKNLRIQYIDWDNLWHIRDSKLGGSHFKFKTEPEAKKKLAELKKDMKSFPATVEFVNTRGGKHINEYISDLMVSDNDGAIFKNINDMGSSVSEAYDVSEIGETIWVKNANQIKSAIANNGDFNPKKDSILLNNGGKIAIGLASNGNTSNLNEIQYKLVRTPEFKAWFGDWENNPELSSKVIDENGEPLVVYHGSDDDFNKFIPNKNVFTRQQGFYFSSNENVSKKYGNIVKSYFINLKDVITYDAEYSSFSEVIQEHPSLEDDLMQQGFAVDGVIINNVYDAPHGNKIGEKANTYCVYDSHNIKLANGKNTTFDLSNDDIRYDNGGSITKDNMKENEETVTLDKVINTPAGGVLIGKSKEGQTIIPEDGTMGGFLAGNLHKNGGIKAINKSNGQPLEMQGNEVVITAPAVADQSKREFEGQMMTNRQILSKINSDGGGVSFADGGEIPAKIHISDKQYNFDGNNEDDIQIVRKLGHNATLKNGGQLFSFFEKTYDINKAYKLINSGEIMFDVKEVDTFPVHYRSFNEKYSKELNPDFSVAQGLMIKYDNGKDLLIDGNHRMNNAYINGIKKIKVYYIDNPKTISKFAKKSSFAEGGNISEKENNESVKISKAKEILINSFPYLSNLDFLGKGLNGYAFLTEINNELFVVKYTKSITEFWVTQMAFVSNPPNIVEIKDVKQISDNYEYGIIHKWVNTDAVPNENIWNVAVGITFKEYKDKLKNIPQKEIDYVSNLAKKLTKEVEDYFGFDIDSSNSNWGYDENQDLVLFDLDGNVNKKKYEDWMKNTSKNIVCEEGGHLSKGKSLEDIAEMHDVSLHHIMQQIALGLEVEKEHTKNEEERIKIAKDHLVENPDYYTILDKPGLENGGKLIPLVVYNEKYKNYRIKVAKSDSGKPNDYSFIIIKFEDGDWLDVMKKDNYKTISEAVSEAEKAIDNGELKSNDENFAKGGKINLAKESEKGDHPSRDLNNYNDVIDLQEDGIVGNHQNFNDNYLSSGVAVSFENGGEVINSSDEEKLKYLLNQKIKYETITTRSKKYPFLNLYKYKDYGVNFGFKNKEDKITIASKELVLCNDFDFKAPYYFICYEPSKHNQISNRVLFTTDYKTLPKAIADIFDAEFADCYVYKNNTSEFVDSESIDSIYQIYPKDEVGVVIDKWVKNQYAYEYSKQQNETTKGYFIVDSENTAYEYAKMINDYFNVFNDIKNEQDLENFKKLQVPWFGTYENQTILHQIERYEKIGLTLGSNEVVRNDFKEAVAKIISNKMEEKPIEKPEKEEIASKKQKSFESEGSKEGKGKLYEFFTPQIVADKMVALAQHYGFTGGNVLEPACGNGRLIKNLKHCNITAFEISKENFKILQSEFPNADLHNYNFEKAFLKSPRFNALLNRKGTETWLKNAPFDLVVANPPYGKFSGLYASYFNFKGQVEHFFILQSLYLLKKGGLGVFLIPSSFLRNGIAYNEIKQKIFEEAEFVDAYRMPSNLFEKTDIGTDILILRKK